jgi:hypothetical protein
MNERRNPGLELILRLVAIGVCLAIGAVVISLLHDRYGGYNKFLPWLVMVMAGLGIGVPIAYYWLRSDGNPVVRWLRGALRGKFLR